MTIATHDGERPLQIDVIAPDARVRDELTRVAGAYTEHVQASSVPSPPCIANARPRTITVVDFDRLDARQRSHLHERMHERGAGPFVLCSDGDEDLASLCEDGHVRHIVARNGDAYLAETGRVLGSLVQRTRVGVEHYFPANFGCGGTRLSDSTVRSDVVSAAELFAVRTGVARRIVNLFATITDELVTNALYNAPVDADGRARFALFSRRQRVTLAADESIVVRWCGSPDRLGVSVTDPFGSLAPQRLASFLAAHLRSEERKPRRGPGGAGLGLRQAFAATSHLVCNIAPGRSTEMIALLDTEGSYRTFAARAKSFHIFVASPGDRVTSRQVRPISDRAS